MKSLFVVDHGGNHLLYVSPNYFLVVLLVKLVAHSLIFLSFKLLRSIVRCLPLTVGVSQILILEVVLEPAPAQSILIVVLQEVVAMLFFSFVVTMWLEILEQILEIPSNKTVGISEDSPTFPEHSRWMSPGGFRPVAIAQRLKRGVNVNQHYC